VDGRLATLADRVIEVLEQQGSRAEPAWAGRRDTIVGVLRDDHPAGAADERPDAVAQLAGVFGLDECEAGILTAAVAPDLDATFAAAYALIHDEPTRTRVSVGVALNLVGIGTLSAAGHAYLAEGSALRRSGLLDVLGEDTFLSRPLRVPDRVVGALLGDDSPDPLVAALAIDSVPVRLDETALLSDALERGVPLCWVHSRPGTAGIALAAGAFAAVDVGHVAVDLSRCPPSRAYADVVAAVCREAALQQAGLVLVGAELLTVEGRISLLQVLELAAVPVIAVSTAPWDPTWSRRSPVQVEAPVLPPSVRAELWTAELGPSVVTDDPYWRDLVSLRLTPEAIVKTARQAGAEAALAGVPLTALTARDAARSLGADAVPGATRVQAAASFSDLIVADSVAADLDRIVGWARLHDEVMTPHGPFSKGGKGRGITALFSGSPGTGKTLAAHALAGELGLDLYRVDLSAVVDKYIGETEKNLERVFHQAESLNVLLFFDEADSLFGSRSEVRDSRDRYANLEVAYLLQRMEQLDGIAILATNLRGNLDSAFSRRLHFIVHFADPDPATRRRLWEHHLLGVTVDPSDPVDIDELSRTMELSGGDIRNIVLAATFDAATQSSGVGQRHVSAAALREYGKLGRRAPATGLEAIAEAAPATPRGLAAGRGR
jgi:predicted nucleic acid-binding protein